MRRALALLAPVILLGAVLGSGAPAGAAPAGDVRFVLAGRLEDPAITVVATGAITGVGTLSAESVDYHPADRTYRETDLADLGAGTLRMSVDGAFDVWPFELDPATCTQHGALTGTWTITAATGDLAGSTGSGTFSGRYVTYSARDPAGCDETAIKGFVAGSMSGTVTD
jgi:hypothetical protein